MSAALALTLASGAAANAAASPGAEVADDDLGELVGVQSQAMVVVGFDADVARAHGYTVATRPDGTEYRVDGPDAEAGLTLPAGVTPFNIVTGDCGSSFVELYDVGVRRYRVSTGFGTYSPAIGYTWSANVIAPSAAYNYTHRWHGVLAATRAFEMNGYATISTGSWTTAKATGWTTHLNGDICRSLGPISSVAIY